MRLAANMLGYYSKHVYLEYSSADKQNADKIRHYLEDTGFKVRTADITQQRHLSSFHGMFFGNTATILVWSTKTVRDSMMTDAGVFLRLGKRCISVTFDGSIPEYGIEEDCFFDLSSWDGVSESPQLSKLAAEVRRIVDVSDVFVSYCREDEAFASRLAAAIAEKDLSVWWDSFLEVGVSFKDVIDKKLSEVRAIVALWSATSIKSNWVLYEAEKGRDRGVLYPVLIDRIIPPIGFRHIHSIKRFGHGVRDIDSLADIISARLAKGASKYIVLSYAVNDYYLAERVYELLSYDNIIWDQPIERVSNLSYAIDSVKAKAVVVLWTEQSINSPIVLAEADKALEQGILISIVPPGLAVPDKYVTENSFHPNTLPKPYQIAHHVESCSRS